MSQSVAELKRLALAKIERLGRREVCRRAGLSRSTLDMCHLPEWNPTAATLAAVIEVQEDQAA